MNPRAQSGVLVPEVHSGSENAYGSGDVPSLDLRSNSWITTPVGAHCPLRWLMIVEVKADWPPKPQIYSMKAVFGPPK